MSTLCSDTRDIDTLKKFSLSDSFCSSATVIGAIGDPVFSQMVNEAVALGARQSDDRPEWVARHLAVSVGVVLAECVAGRLFVELDPDLSFDTNAMVARGDEILRCFSARGIARERIVLCLAATWEGVMATRHLQRMGADCNLTMVFSTVQAMAGAEAGAFMISSCVGPISRWFGRSMHHLREPGLDPAVNVLRDIVDHCRARGVTTAVSATAFQSIQQIGALAGCDRLCIAPTHLQTLCEDRGRLKPWHSARSLDTGDDAAKDEWQFRWAVNEDAMATELLCDGVRSLGADLASLRRIAGKLLLGAARSG